MANFWSWLLGGKTRSAPAEAREPSERVHAVLAELKARQRPSLRLVSDRAGSSRLGGRAQMSSDWPRYKEKPLSLVAQLDLSSVSAAGGPDWLPREGRLLFFYELDASTWGFDPKDAGSAVVRHESIEAHEAEEPPDLALDFRFDPHPIAFVAAASVPSEERLDIDWKTMSPRDKADIEAAVESMAVPEPAHQLGGYPSPIQGDGMELECQLATNGIYVGNSKGYAASQVEALKLGAADWRLLLQLDTDAEAGMMWGDTGRLYFWIREQDARAGDFSKVWAILQCL